MGKVKREVKTERVNDMSQNQTCKCITH